VSSLQQASTPKGEKNKGGNFTTKNSEGRIGLFFLPSQKKKKIMGSLSMGHSLFFFNSHVSVQLLSGV
jgi:hypothetical protein